MLNHCVGKYVAENVSRLINNAGVRNCIDHPPLAVTLRVLQSKGKTRQRFAAAGGNCQRKYSRHFTRLVPTLPKHIGTDTVHTCKRDI